MNIKKAKVPKPQVTHYDIFNKWPIWKSILKMAIPSVIMMLIMGAYFFSDSILSINFAADSYKDGLMSSEDQVRLYMNGYSPINSLMIAIILLFSVGVATRVSINLGAGNKERAINTIKTGMMIGMILSIIMVPAMMFSTKPWIASQYNESIANTVADNARDYAWIVIGIFPINLFNNVVASLFRTEARNKESMIAMLLPIFLNLFLDWVLMGPGQMDVSGGAWATFISYVVTFLLFVFFIVRRKESIIVFKNMFSGKFKLIPVFGIILVGIAPFLRNFSQSITSTVQMNVIQQVSQKVYEGQGFNLSSLDAMVKVEMGIMFKGLQDHNALITNDVLSIFKDIGYDPQTGNSETLIKWLLLNQSDTRLTNIKLLAAKSFESNFMTLIVTGVMPVFGLFFPVMFAFPQASSPIASYNYGAKNIKRVKEVYLWTILYAFITALIIYFVVAFGIGGPLMSLLKVTDVTLVKAKMILKIMMIGMPAFAIAMGGMTIFGSTDRLLFSIISSSFQGLIAFWPIIFTFKEIALNSSYEYSFWFYFAVTTAISSIVISFMAYLTMKNLHKSHITLDEKINNIYAWAKNKNEKRLSRKNNS